MIIKACLFDLDGTLLNTLTSIRYYLNRTLEKYGVRTVSEKETRLFVGCGARRLIESSLTAGGINLNTPEGLELFSAIHKEYVESYDREPEYLTEPYDGIPDAVERLYERGIKLAVISNKPDETVKQLVRLIFGDKFDIIEGASDRMPLKPDPKWPLDICERLGVKPYEVAYFGDTSTDMQTAKNFGAGLSVGVCWGFRETAELVGNGADTVISHPNEIIGLIK